MRVFIITFEAKTSTLGETTTIKTTTQWTLEDNKNFYLPEIINSFKTQYSCHDIVITNFWETRALIKNGELQ